jgi:hypothetical protein
MKTLPRLQLTSQELWDPHSIYDDQLAIPILHDHRALGYHSSSTTRTPTEPEPSDDPTPQDFFDNSTSDSRTIEQAQREPTLPEDFNIAPVPVPEPIVTEIDTDPLPTSGGDELVEIEDTSVQNTLVQDYEIEDMQIITGSDKITKPDKNTQTVVKHTQQVSDHTHRHNPNRNRKTDPPGHILEQTRSHPQPFGSDTGSTYAHTYPNADIHVRHDPTDGTEEIITTIPRNIKTTDNKHDELDSTGTIGFMSANVSEIVHHHKIMTANGFSRCAKRPPQEPPTEQREQDFIKKTVRFDTNTDAEEELSQLSDNKTTTQANTESPHANDDNLFSETTKWGTFAYAHLLQTDQPELVHMIIPTNKQNEYEAYVSSFDIAITSPNPRKNYNPNYLAIDGDVLTCENDVDTSLATAKDNKTKDKKQHLLLDN